MTPVRFQSISVTEPTVPWVVCSMRLLRISLVSYGRFTPSGVTRFCFGATPLLHLSEHGGLVHVFTGIRDLTNPLDSIRNATREVLAPKTGYKPAVDVWVRS